MLYDGEPISATMSASAGMRAGSPAGPLPYEKNVDGRLVPTAALKHHPGSSSQSSLVYPVKRGTSIATFELFPWYILTPESPACRFILVDVHLSRAELFACSVAIALVL